MISKTAIADKVLAIMASELKRDVNSLSLDQRLKEDLELNSLDAIELVFRFEGDFDLSILVHAARHGPDAVRGPARAGVHANLAHHASCCGKRARRAAASWQAGKWSVPPRPTRAS